uniref:NB-ARC domain-containing protein n=1 Tax=Odontella aurita TaxID=265563 RepID=A0A7S4N200_9STRA|mmetsp:Transcript_443/g.1341  ORF Transcript_443/g.1341 Transcript_443/m.1341 type:complete len:2222 (+) Transcript_443:170-6835(+)
MSAVTSRQRRSGPGGKRRDRLDALEGLADSARKLRLTDDDDFNYDGALEMTGGGGTGVGGSGKPSGGRRSRNRPGAAQRRNSATSQVSTRSEISTNSAASDMAVAPKFDEQIRRSRGARGVAAGAGRGHPRSSLDRRTRAKVGRGFGAASGRGRPTQSAQEGASPSSGRADLLVDASFSSSHSVSSMATVKVNNKAHRQQPLPREEFVLDSSHSAKTIQMDNKKSRPRQRLGVSNGVGGGGSARSMTSTESAASEGSSASRGEEKKRDKSERRKSRDKKDRSGMSRSGSSSSVRSPSDRDLSIEARNDAGDDDGGNTDVAVDGDENEGGRGSSDAALECPVIVYEEGLDDEALENRDQFGAECENLPDTEDPALLDQMGPEDRTAFLCRGLADSVQSLVTALYSLEDGNRGFPTSVSAAILDHTDSIDLAINRIKPVVASIDAGELDSDAMTSESIGTYLGRIGRLVDMLTETLTYAGQSRVWTSGSEVCYVTLLELLQRSCLELRHFYDAECGGAGAPGGAAESEDSENALGAALPEIFPDSWDLGPKVARAWIAAGQEDRLRSLGVDPEKLSAPSSPSVDHHGFPIESTMVSSSASPGGPVIEVNPEAFRAVALEVLLSNLEWTPNSIADVREACAFVQEDGEGVVDEDNADAECAGAESAESSSGPGASRSFSKKKGGSSVKSTEGATTALLAVSEEQEAQDKEDVEAKAASSLVDREEEQLKQEREQRVREEKAAHPSKEKKERQGSGSDKKQQATRLEEENEASKLPPGPEVAEGPMADVPNAARHVLGRIRGSPLPRQDFVDRVTKKLISDALSASGHAGKSESSRSVGSSSASASASRGDGGVVVVTSQPFGGYDGESSTPTSSHRPDSGFGMEGAGKTTIAALVVSRADVRQRFSGGVVWLDVGRRFGHGGDCESCQRDYSDTGSSTRGRDAGLLPQSVGEGPMSYVEYRSYLESMCCQLGIQSKSMPRFDDAEDPTSSAAGLAPSASPTSPPLRSPDEPSPAERRKTEHCAMKTAWRRAAAIFRDRKGDVLLVLDDVAAEEDLRWFSFLLSSHGSDVDGFSAPHLLVTTRNRRIGKSLGSGAVVGGRVDVGVLEAEEAMGLLLSESDEGGQDKQKTAEKASLAAAAIVSRCRCHPLAIRVAGQWCRLKKAAVGMGTAVEEVGEEVEKCWERARVKQSRRGGERERGRHDTVGGGENIIVYEILGRVLSPLMGGKETSVIKLCFAALACVFTSWVPCIPLDLAMALWEGVLLAEGEVGDELGERDRAGADVDGSTSTASALQEAESFARMSAKQRRNQIRLIAEAMSSLGAVQLSTKRRRDKTTKDGRTVDDSDAAEKFLEIHHGIVQEYGEYLCTEQGGLIDGLIRDCERRWNQAFVSSFISLKGDSGWDDLGVSTNCQDYALNMIVSHMIRAEMYHEARELLTDNTFARGRLSLLGCEAGTRRHVRDSEELCRRMRMVANGVGAGVAGGMESRKTLAQSYAKFSAIIGAEVQRNQGANDVESSLTACRALDRIGLSFVRNKCWREAIGLYEATVKFLKSAGHDDSDLVAIMLYNVGTAYFELDEYESSFKAYGNCVKVREKTLGENNITFLLTLHRMGDALAESWKLEPALQCYDKAVLAMRLNPSMERNILGNVLMSKGRVKLKRGELQEALKCGEESLRIKRAELGSGNEILSREYAFLSDVCAERGEVEEAKSHLDEAIRLKRSKPLDSHGGDMLLFKGSRHRLNGEYDDCLIYYNKALDSLKSSHGFRKGEVADLSLMVGIAYALKGDSAAAIKTFEESLRSRRLRSRKSDLDVALTLFEMGLCHKRLGQYDKALQCLDESLSIRNHQLGECELVMLTLIEIGMVHAALKEIEKASTLYDESLQMCQKLLGTDHEHCATILHEQGVLQSETNGGEEESMKCFDKSLEIRRQRLGADHPSVGETLHMMGYVLISQNNKYETAEYCLQEALRIRKAYFGNDDQQVADTIHTLGTLQEQIGKSDNAIKLLNDALRIRRLAGNQSKIAKSLNDVGTVYRLKQHYDLAIECFEESLGIFLQDMDNNQENILSAHIALGDSEAALGRSRGACTHYEQALDTMMQVPSNAPERIPRLLQKIGILEHKIGETDKAKNHLLGYILLWKESGMDDDIDYVNALHIVGTIHRANGEAEKAQDCWAEAYQTYHDKGLAAKNPQLGDELKRLLQEIARETGTFKNSIFSKFRDGLLDEAA